MARDEIILIGPIGAGKSTVGRIIARRLGLPQVPMDDLRFDYYEEIGYDRAYVEQLQQANDFASVIKYWKPFELHAVQRLLADYQNCVIDFGAGHSVQEDDALFAQLQIAMAPFSNVVLLQPDPDVNVSTQIINSHEEWLKEVEDINRHFLQHPSNRTLAKHVVYTGAMDAEQVADAVLTNASMRETPWRKQSGALRTAKEVFMVLAEALPETHRELVGACDEWTPRRVVAQLAGWQQETRSRFDELRAPFAEYKHKHDANASMTSAVAARADLNWDETIKDLNDQHHALLLAIARVSDADLARTTDFADQLGVVTDHFARRASQLRD